MRIIMTLVALVAPATRAQVLPPLVTKPLFVNAEGFEPNFGRSSLAIVDLNGDGYLDLAAPGGDGTGVGVRYGLGQGNFSDYSLFALGSPVGWPTDIEFADADADGDQDLLVSRVTTSSLLINDGLGRFVDGSQAAFGMPGIVGRVYSSAFADIDRDGRLDIVLGCDGIMRTFMGDGQGHFVEDTSRMPGIAQFTDDMVVIDMDGDGAVDIVTANGGGFRADWNHVFFNDGVGRFFNYLRLPGGQGQGMCVSVGDIDGDGDLDVLIARLHGSNLLLRNDGFRAFSDVSDWLTPNAPVRSEACLIADVDDDGDNDLIIGSSGDLHVQLNDGRGRFRRMSSESIWGTGTSHLFGIVWSLHYHDLDNDGDRDLYVCQSGAHAVFFWIVFTTEIYFGARTHLWSTGFAPLGSLATLYVFGFEGVAFLAFAGNRPTTPLSTPFGALWLDPATLIIDPVPISISANEVGWRQVAIPNTPALRGRSLHTQALLLSSRPPWSRLTNWHKIVIQ